ncbi:hypothetical protein GCM10017673_26070 [Streptosporangium violaceochromogenes]|nr:hypothetical protein GCM10017673_26070 [Streptosporangium violaceochromogenes]
MRTGWAAVAEVDWSRLFHAYGPASDTPGHLRALVGDDAAARARAVDHLFGAVIHQGTIWTVTPPAALVVAGLLADPRTAGLGAAPAERGAFEAAPLRAVLLGFLCEVTEASAPQVPEGELRAAAFPWGREAEIAATLEAILAEDGDAWDDELADALVARAVLDLRAAVPALVGAVTACLDDDSARVRSAAAGTLAALATVPGAVAPPVSSPARERAAREGR